MSDKLTRREFLNKNIRLGLGLSVAGSLPWVKLGCASHEFDYIIKNGTIVDGSGKSSFEGDIGISSHFIKEIGDLSNRTTARTIDASNLVVCPGFIDVHSHSDICLIVNPNADSKIRQGVTTEISGNCGFSPFPISEENIEKYQEKNKEKYDIHVDWNDCDSFFRRMEKEGVALNYATLMGHSTIRETVMGMENKAATDSDLKQMMYELEKGMDQGALGLSTGLEYTPGSFASTEELIHLCEVLPKYDGIYATHMRNEDARVVEAVAEAIEIGKKAGVSVEISHLKACQKKNWHLVDRFLKQIEDARNEGLNIHADRYPYIAYNTSLKMLFPLWAREGDTEDIMARFENKAQIDKIRPLVEQKVRDIGSWDSVLISYISSDERSHCAGKTVLQNAADEKLEPFEWVRQTLIAEKGSVSMVVFAMDEETTIDVLQASFTMIGSDGDSLSATGILSRGNPHPRNFGTFPRVLGYYLRDRKILELEEGIRKMTSLPAQKFGLKKRGLIQPGNYADIVMFDLNKVTDTATFLQPKQYPKGIKHVLVNGEWVIRDEAHTNKLPGMILGRS